MKKKILLYLAPVFLLLVTVVLLSSCLRPQESLAGEPGTFSSHEDLVNYIKRNVELAGQYRYYSDAAVSVQALAPTADMQRMKQSAVTENVIAADNGQVDYSRTNIQVEGVDEADIVKSDGEYLYVASGDKVFIIAAYPPDKAKVVSEIKFKGQPVDVFVNKDRLAVFGCGADSSGIFIKIYDLADKSKPVLKKSVNLSNSDYVTSRMIGEYIYVVADTPVNYYPAEAEDKVNLPEIAVDGVPKIIGPDRIYYFNCPDHSYRYTRLLALNILDESRDITEKTFLTGVSQNIFAAESSIYLTGSKTPDYLRHSNELFDKLKELLPPEIGAEITKLKDSGESTTGKLQRVEELLANYINSLNYEEGIELEIKIRECRERFYRNIAREGNNTVIHKMAVSKEEIVYKGSGEVPGRVLNQFSMDEHQGFFRIATTTESSLILDRPTTRNNVYVLDEDLKMVGKLEGLAPTERIYSARFMGNRAYLVTFRQIDPLFVIDLKDPANPRVLGELKIPGYSDYLHPYDENHLIGIGREVSVEPWPAPASPIGPAERPELIRISPPSPRSQGVKVALFDVSDPAKPRELSKYVVEDGYSDSLALRDHKAVLFSRSKNLLAIPISLSPPFRIMEGSESNPYVSGWQGVYVLNISPENGIKLKGKVQHSGDSLYDKEVSAPVKRSLYIEDVLYTVSDRLVKMNGLKDLKEINRVKLD